MKQKHFLLLFLALLMSLGARAQDVITLSDFGNSSKWTPMFSAWGSQTSEWKTSSTYNDAFGTLALGYSQAAYRTGDLSGVLQLVASQGGAVNLPVIAGRRITRVQVVAHSTQAEKAYVTLIDRMTEQPLGTLTKAENVINIPEDKLTFGASYQLSSSGSGNSPLITSIIITLEDVHKTNPGLAFNTDRYYVFSGETKAYPTLTTEHAVSPIKYESSNKDVVEVSEDGKSYTQKKPGKAVITARYAGDDEYYSAHASYTFIIADPTTPATLNITSYEYANDTQLQPRTLKDASEMVQFQFNKGTGNTNPIYSTERTGLVRTFAGNTLTVTVQPELTALGYVIDRIEFTNASGDVSPLTECDVTSGTSYDATTRTWKFNGLNLTTSTLTVKDSEAKLKEITVYLRKAIFTINPVESTLKVKRGVEVDLTKYFTISNLLTGDKAADFISKLNFSSSNQDAGTLSGTTFTGNVAGAQTTITASFEGEGKYGEAKSASFTLQVLDKQPYTMTFAAKDKEIALYGSNGMNTYDAKTGLSIKKEDGTDSNKKGTYAISVPENNGVVKVKSGTTLETIAEGTVVVTVTYSPDATEGEDYAETQATFNLKVDDMRATLAASFAKKVYPHLTTSKEAFVSPELTLPANSGLTASSFGWSSDNTAVANVNEEGVVTLTGAAGNANIKVVLPKEGTNYKYLPFETSYKIVVVNPTESALESAPVVNATNLKNVTDESGLIRFGFDGATYNALRNYITLNSNGVLTVFLTDTKYYIKDVEIEYYDANVLNEVRVSEGTSFANGKWNFAGTDLQSATLTNLGAQANIKNVKVSLRLAKLNVTTKDASFKKTVGENEPHTFNVADYVTVTNHKGEVITAPAEMTFDMEADSNVATIKDGVVTIGKEVGTATITINFPGNDVYMAIEPKTMTLTVTDQTPVIVEFAKDVVELDYKNVVEGSNAFNLKDFASAKIGSEAFTGNYTVDYEATGDNKDNVTIDNVAKTIKVAEGVEEDAEVTVVATITPEDIENYQFGTASFIVKLIDGRASVKMEFAQLNYTFDASSTATFSNPKPTVTVAEGVDAPALKWEVVEPAYGVTVNDGVLDFANLAAGINTIVVKASVLDETKYKAASAQYNLKVTGKAMLANAYNEANIATGADVKVRGFIVGTMDANGNLVKEAANFTDDNIVICEDANGEGVLIPVTFTGAKNTTFKGSYNLKNNPSYVGNSIIVTGVKATVNTKSNGVGAISAIQMLRTPLVSMPVNTAMGNTVAISVPADYTKTVNVSVTNNPEGVTVDGLSVKFENAGVYEVVVTTEEQLPTYQAATRKFTVRVSPNDITYLAEGKTYIAETKDFAPKYTHLYYAFGVTPATTVGGTTLETKDGTINWTGHDKESGNLYVRTVVGEGDDAMVSSATKLFYDFSDETGKATLSIGYVVGASDDYWNKPVYVSVRTTDGVNYGWTQMTSEKKVSHDKDLLTASVTIPAFEEKLMLGGYKAEVEDDVRKNLIPMTGNTQVANSVCGDLLNTSSKLIVIFSDKEEEYDGSKVFKNAPLTMEADGTGNQTVIFADAEVYSGLFVVDTNLNVVDGIDQLENVTGFGYWEDKLQNNTNWRGNINHDVVKTGFYLTTAVKDGKAVGTIFGKAKASGKPALAPRRVMAKAGNEVTHAIASATPENYSDVIEPVTDSRGKIGIELNAPANGQGTAVVSDDVTTSIDEIAADADADVMWYTLTGVRIQAPTQSGVYVRVRDGKAQKVIVRD